MNSLERKEKRYQRRKMLREQKRLERSEKYASLENAFCFHKVMYYAHRCCLGVGWKNSTKNFKLHEFTNIATTCYNIKNNKYKVGKTYKFKINERGKVRDIDAPHIKDRLVHKVLSNEIIQPIYNPNLIYDNGASQKNKGFMFALYRLKKKLNSYYHNNGYNGYAVLVDYSKYFENCSHDVIHEIHKKYIKDDYIIKVIEDYLFIGKGIALGIEIAQIEAGMVPNVLDKFIINKGYPLIRYMDDSVFIVNSKEEALEVLEDYYVIADKLGIKINKKKTSIVPLNNYFRYCKWNFKILDSGKVIMVPYKKTVYRQRRKLRRMYSLYLNKKIDGDDIKISKTCFKAYLNIGNSNKYIKYLNKRYIVDNKSEYTEYLELESKLSDLFKSKFYIEKS